MRLLVAALSGIWYNLALSSGGISKNCYNTFVSSTGLTVNGQNKGKEGQNKGTEML